MPGTEGGFHICTTWLIRSLLLIGERDRATELFESMLKLGGPTGLFPEEWDPTEQRSLGNHPQAYTHLGLIECAHALEKAWATEAPKVEVERLS